VSGAKGKENEKRGEAEPHEKRESERYKVRREKEEGLEERVWRARMLATSCHESKGLPAAPSFQLVKRTFALLANLDETGADPVPTDACANSEHGQPAACPKKVAQQRDVSRSPPRCLQSMAKQSQTRYAERREAPTRSSNEKLRAYPLRVAVGAAPNPINALEPSRKVTKCLRSAARILHVTNEMSNGSCKSALFVERKVRATTGWTRKYVIEGLLPQTAIYAKSVCVVLYDSPVDRELATLKKPAHEEGNAILSRLGKCKCQASAVYA
jgi:hypothetical protein